MIWGLGLGSEEDEDDDNQTSLDASQKIEKRGPADCAYSELKVSRPVGPFELSLTMPAGPF